MGKSEHNLDSRAGEVSGRGGSAAREPGQREEPLWRYMAPNLITMCSMALGLGAMFQAIEGAYVSSAWLILFAVLADKLDGVVARLVRGTSELGVQLDSLADALNFGVAPAVLVFASLGREASLPFDSGAGRIVLFVACVVWVLGAIFRLARFNVSTAQQIDKRMWFGVPTTMAAGILATSFLALLKYTPVSHGLAVDGFGGAKLFPFFETPDAAWRYLPLALFAGGVLMASNLRMASFGGVDSRWFKAFMASNVIVGYILIPARMYPEFLMWQPISWAVVFLVLGQFSRNARLQKAPPVFPRVPLPDDSGAIFPEIQGETDDELAHRHE